MNTTLNNIRKHNPCEDSWKKLLLSLKKTEADDEALPLRYILDTLGIDDAIWSLRSLEGADRDIRLFACDCAERVLHIYEAKRPDDSRLRNAIEVARRYSNGEATDIELAAALEAARAAAGDAALEAARAARAARDAAREAARAAGAAREAARAAAGDAARAAGYAAWAAWDAAWDAEREDQKKLFIKHFC